MAANEHNPHKCEAQDAKVEHFCAAVHALLGMSKAHESDKPLHLEDLIRVLAGFDGADAAQVCWELIRDTAREHTKLNHAHPSAPVRQRVLGRLLEFVALVENQPADPFQSLRLVGAR